MQKKLKRILACLIASTPLVSLSCVGCSNYEGIVVANFESYMSSKLMDDVHDEYKCKFLYYDTNETIETKFEKNYDIAIPSSYESMILKKKGYLSKSA